MVAKIMCLSKLFPSDTRIAEILSAVSLLFSGLLMLLVPQATPLALLTYHTAFFWGMIALVFGLLQLIVVVWYDDQELARALFAWIVGTYWVWMSLGTVSMTVVPAIIASFFLGVTNLYSFIVNVLVVKKQWNS